MICTSQSATSVLCSQIVMITIPQFLKIVKSCFTIYDFYQIVEFFTNCEVPKNKLCYVVKL